MKKTVGSFCLFFLSHLVFGQVNSNLVPYAGNVFYTTENKLTFVKLNESQAPAEAGVAEFINSVLFNDGPNKVSVLKTERDALGFSHIKFSILQNGVMLANKVIVAHCSKGKLISINGDLSGPAAAENSFSISEEQALALALAKVNAKKYKWENKAEEAHMRQALNEAAFSYAPQAKKMILEKDGNLYNTYCFNIYAEEPLYRANVFVDASSGKILDEQNLICQADVPATANTKYSGTQAFVNDYNGSLYRLRETQRGQGIETYNMKNTGIYTSTDFTNTTSNWTSTGVDQAATDAHWGAEMTYDYYSTQHNRNSIDNAGYKLLSYVHYMTGYTNAFWDGQRMTYGDGNSSSLKIFTALDICGHEISHGLTENTASLMYSNESGALNECFSDIFGTSIENYGRPGNWNWKIGEDITPNAVGLRSMSNPNLFHNPDTYGGTYYFNGTADNGGVHTNSSVGNYWFYLLSNGGSGTNDLTHAYSVTGIGISDAAKIAFRALTVYFTPTTNYATARLLTIQAAKDLFGNCSYEVAATTSAWYAVGVGGNYSNNPGPDFVSNMSNFCSSPASVTFSNTTLNGLSYTWDFGDGSAVVTTTNAVHTYTAVGVYTVKLKALGCANSLDSITKTSYIVVNAPIASPAVVPSATSCENGTAILTGSGSSTLKWYALPNGGNALGSGNAFTTPNLTITTTFYAANTLTLAAVTGGIPSNTGGTYSNSNANYLVFDVQQPGVLNSVVMYAQTIGNRVIQLRNAANTVLYTTTVMLGIGANTVVLNYNLTPGTNYRLGLSNTSATNVYRTTTGVNYPYNIGGCVNIKTSNSGSSVYYYFYKWNVSKQECASPRIPVVVTVNPAPAVSIDNVPVNAVCSDDRIDLQGSPAGGTYNGTGINGAIFNAGTLGAGTYTVNYTYTDANSCSNSAAATLIVEECTGISTPDAAAGSIRIYPNPAKDNLVVSSALANAAIVITDATGRVVLTKNMTSAEEKIQLNGISNGLYMISIYDHSGRTIKTSKLIKE